MSGHDDDDGWIHQVAEALEGLDLFDDGVRRALIDGVRRALERPEDGPSVTVIRGGATPPPPPADGKPHLRVIAPDDPEVAPPPAGLADSRVTVRVLPDAKPPPTPPADLTCGHIALDGGDDVWQTLWHGGRPAAYRVHCDLGELHLASDGELVLRLEQGQSADLEGRVVRVRGFSGPARGRYVRVRD